MLQAPPAIPGMREDEIDTPALVIDLDAFESNLDTMAALLAPTGVKLRAHAKTHKSPIIAKLQMARGAVGNCVQKVAEAEVLAWGGIPDILVSNEVVGAAKLARLCALSRIAKVAVCADDAGQVAAIEAAAADAGIRMTVLVEIDVGAGRCGVQPGPDAVALATRIAGVEAPDLRRTAGLSWQRPAQADPGGTAHADRRCRRCLSPDGGAASPAGPGLCDRRRRGNRYVRDRIRTPASITRCRPAATSSWTPTMRRNLDEAGAPVSTFRHALFVLSTVMSQASRAWPCWMPGTRRWRSIRTADGLAAAGYPLHQRLRRARQAAVRQRDRGAEGGGETAAGAGPLRPDGRQVRLVCRCAPRAGRVPVAGRGPRGTELAPKA